MSTAQQSKHIRKVVKSILSAETLAIVDMSEVCLFYNKLLSELLQQEGKIENIKIICKTDNSMLMLVTVCMVKAHC